MRLRFTAVSLLALSLGACATTSMEPASAIPASAEQVTAAEPASVEELVSAVSIPYERFTLDNGLTVLVHTDRKAPVVGVSVWYAVGSKHEPEGKTGFAHLFEHLMFNGSENSPGDFFEPLQQVGATDFNGTTWFDRTNYFQTVPTGALDRALMLESDRMGYLLGAVTQEKLDNQIGVVQNEKRQGDNQPYGLTEYEQLENLYPSGHPYHHSTIGSMDDLSSATLDDVKQWFRDHYGPNNAVLALAGDIDVATAKAKVSKWFGAIPAGPAIKPVAAPVPDLDAPLEKTIYDRVATPRIYRMWAVPGLDNPDYLPLTMGGTVLGGLASSRLDNALVREQQLAVSVVARAEIFAQAGQFVVYADAKPGVDEGTLAAALDAQIAKFLAEGPTADELQRATTTYAAGQIRGLEQVGGFGGKAPTLAEGLLYQGNPSAYKEALERAAAMTPEEVRSVTSKWLSRPVFSLTVEPGDRTEGGENRGGYIVAPEAGSGMQPAFYNGPFAAQSMGAAANTATAQADRSKLPDVEELRPLDFPDIERATLSNGMEVYFARRDAVPVVNVEIEFDAGYAADPKQRLGLQSMMLQMMDEGTTTLDSTELAIAKERLGAALYAIADADKTTIGLAAMEPNLAPSLELMADYVRNPAFDPKELERVRTQQLTRIKNELNDPGSIGQRALAPALFGTDHPYGIPPTGTGDPAVVSILTREELGDFHRVWIRPDMAKVFIVGDTNLADAVKLLEASFGDWRAPGVPAPTKDFTAPIPSQTSRVILINRPNSPQSVILAGRVLPQKGTEDLLVLGSANEVFGGSFLSRINMNLRETKGWSYGVRSILRQPIDQTSLLIYAPVQADRTGDSIVELRKDLAAYTGGQGVTAQELERMVNGNVRELPGRFETSRAVLGGIQSIVNYGRPDDYYETLAERYSNLTAQQIDAEAKANLLGDDLVFVIVGDAAVISPQLDKLGLPVETREAAGD
ncbi:insulinase family protein [Altererythrobacter sediminis]|uniref:Insulinase family protein n=2 Tax=Allopontixanthobacter sediminis TaxID=1689985 RepID=A0A845B6S5_9SPHN|nr:insulinase family protein [Allopontixanthobacter sediminis]